MTWYGIVSIVFGVFALATAIYAATQRDRRTVLLGTLAGVIFVAFGLWLFGQ
jgi:phosphotransferase system  glucose/maltose/N-acetylglucosamine-specific IIC component